MFTYPIRELPVYRFIKGFQPVFPAALLPGIVTDDLLVYQSSTTAMYIQPNPLTITLVISMPHHWLGLSGPGLLLPDVLCRF